MELKIDGIKREVSIYPIDKAWMYLGDGLYDFPRFVALFPAVTDEEKGFGNIFAYGLNFYDGASSISCKECIKLELRGILNWYSLERLIEEYEECKTEVDKRRNLMFVLHDFQAHQVPIHPDAIEKAEIKYGINLDEFK